MAGINGCNFRAIGVDPGGFVSGRKRGSHGQKGRRGQARCRRRRVRGRAPKYGRSRDADRPQFARAMPELPYAALSHIQLLHFDPGAGPGTAGRVVTVSMGS